MRLRKRIEQLELLQKQATCGHRYRSLRIEELCSQLDIKATCSLCGKTISRTTVNTKLLTAEGVLRNFLLGINDGNS